MKSLKSHRSLNVFLAGWFLFVNISSGAASVEKLPSIAPARYSMVDSRTYTAELESQKKYDQFLSLLRSEFSAIQLMELNVRGGIHLTEREKADIAEVFSAVGSKDPINDFLRMRQIDPATKAYDLEGKLYILDDMAHIYTYGLVDFKKAQEHNKQAEALYQRIARVGLENVPISDYYNNRRFFYNALFYVPAGKMPAGFHSAPGRIDLITPFPDHYLQSARKMDFDRVGERIRVRRLFLEAKLGEVKAITPPVYEARPASSARKLSEQFAAFIQEDMRQLYDPFQANYLLADEAYKSYRARGNRAALLDMVRYGQAALAVPVERNAENQDRKNLLHYWTGLACLKLGSFQDGIAHMESFLAGIDELEKVQQESGEHRRVVVERANKESMEAAQRSARWQQAFAILLMVAAGAAIGPTSQNFYDSMRGVVDVSREIMGNAQTYISQAARDTALRSELARYITPYSLKVNRYLNKYEMVDYFLESGKAYESLGQLDRALIQYEEAIRIIERQRSTILTEQQRISFFAAQQVIYERIIQTLLRLNRPEDAIEYVERAKSRAFVDVLGSSKIKLKTKEQTDRLAVAVTGLAEVDTLLADKSVGADQINDLVKKAQRGVKLKGKEASAQDAGQEIELLSLSNVQTITAAEIKKMGARDATLVEYYLAGDKLHIFLVNHKGINAFSQPVQSTEVVGKANLWLASMSKGEEASELASYFYRLLIAPVEEQIKTDQIVVIPHNVLHYLPFQAIFDGKQHLIHKYAISYAPSITVINLAERKISAGNGQTLIIGNPTKDLQFAEVEAEAISRLFNGSVLLTGEKGTESYVKSRGGEFDYIHFATHGVYDEQTPLKSLIRLGSDQDNDGELTAAELFSTQWKASLVTLSACETGLSKLKSGDELIGLQRALLFAGTRSIVSSLWKVDDKATHFLMTSFYRNLSAMPKNKALQKAQVDTMKEFKNPYFWAAFNLSGAMN